MIQTQTEILLKDNSDLLKGRVINTPHTVRTSGLGDSVKLAITKVKNKIKHSKKQSASRISKSQLSDALVIQTKKLKPRLDGSSIAFNANSGVAVSFSKAGKLTLGFKRINTSVPFELKLINQRPRFRGNVNLIKCAKGLI